LQNHDCKSYVYDATVYGQQALNMLTTNLAYYCLLLNIMAVPALGRVRPKATNKKSF